MIEITHRETIDEFLALPENSGFWHETGGKRYPIPDRFRAIYEAGCMMLIEPFGRFVAVHLICLKKSRGKKGIKFAKDCISWIKANINPLLILTKVERERKEAVFMARLLGMNMYKSNEKYVYFEVI